jgi:hypothetical protein
VPRLIRIGAAAGWAAPWAGAIAGLPCARRQRSRRLVIAVLGDKPAADGEVEDGLAELLDVLGAGGEAWEVAEVEAGAVAEGLTVERGHDP